MFKRNVSTITNEKCTYSAQHGKSIFPKQKVKCSKANLESTSYRFCNSDTQPPCSVSFEGVQKNKSVQCCEHYDITCNCSYTVPPIPPKPNDDLWDLQFCRWWGWNWIRKRDEIACRSQNMKSIAKRKNNLCARKKKRPKQNHFFSWCRKLFNSGRNSSLKVKDKKQLDDLYNTPCSSIAFSQNICSNYVERPCHDQQNTNCCLNKSTQFSKHMCAQNKMQPQISKCNKRTCQSWIFEETSSCSSEECCVNAPDFISEKRKKCNANESVQYLTMRHHVVTSDEGLSKCSYIQKDYKSSCNKSPCSVKKIKIHNPYYTHNCTQTIIPCNTEFQSKYPQFCRYPNCNKIKICKCPKSYFAYCKSNTDDCQIQHECICKRNCIKKRNKNNYGMTKQKLCCCCCCKHSPHLKENLKITKQYPKKDFKLFKTLDKSVSTQNFEEQGNAPMCSIRSLNHNFEKNRNNLPTNNATQFSILQCLRSGAYQSPHSGEIYKINPTNVSVEPMQFQKPIDINNLMMPKDFETNQFLNRDNKEHKLLLSAVCEAMLSSQFTEHLSINDTNILYPKHKKQETITTKKAHRCSSFFQKLKNTAKQNKLNLPASSSNNKSNKKSVLLTKANSSRSYDHILQQNLKNVNSSIKLKNRQSSSPCINKTEMPSKTHTDNFQFVESQIPETSAQDIKNSNSDMINEQYLDHLLCMTHLSKINNDLVEGDLELLSSHLCPALKVILDCQEKISKTLRTRDTYNTNLNNSSVQNSIPKKQNFDNEVQDWQLLNLNNMDTLQSSSEAQKDLDYSSKLLYTQKIDSCDVLHWNYKLPNSNSTSIEEIDFKTYSPSPRNVLSPHF